MRIAISGSVGVGKTTITKLLSKKLQFDIIHLNDIAQKFKKEDIIQLQTFDFDVEKCLNFIEKEFENKNNIIFEGHFAHLLSPDFIDILIIINRDLKELHQEYIQRGYNEQKVKDNLEVESLNVCFYEAEEEGFKDYQFIVFENSQDFEVEEVVQILLKKIQKKIGKCKY
ncbi:MAG: AAA family ATPase [Nanoarchaeota archaeon]|nr:AAA family ATPase [Nanoarchaeota archaeon]